MNIRELFQSRGMLIFVILLIVVLMILFASLTNEPEKPIEVFLDETPSPERQDESASLATQEPGQSGTKKCYGKFQGMRVPRPCPDEIARQEKLRKELLRQLNYWGTQDAKRLPLMELNLNQMDIYDLEEAKSHIATPFPLLNRP